jgi:hypothetical protein
VRSTFTLKPCINARTRVFRMMYEARSYIIGAYGTLGKFCISLLCQRWLKEQ